MGELVRRYPELGPNLVDRIIDQILVGRGEQEVRPAASGHAFAPPPQSLGSADPERCRHQNSDCPCGHPTVDLAMRETQHPELASHVGAVATEHMHEVVQRDASVNDVVEVVVPAQSLCNGGKVVVGVVVEPRVEAVLRHEVEIRVAEAALRAGAEPAGIGEEFDHVRSILEEPLSTGRIPKLVVGALKAGAADREDQLEELLVVLDRVQHPSPRRNGASEIHTDAEALVDHNTSTLDGAVWKSTAVTDGFFDERIAARYDDSCGEMNDPFILGLTVDFLAEIAGGGRALEFASGTGRVALPLSERGVEVHGIELSRAMVDQMRAKPGAERIEVAIGDMATTRVEGTFTLVYLVYNTITNLLTQDEQVECFRNAATHLEPSGRFVVEVLVPELQRLPKGESFLPFDVGPGHLGIDEYDTVDQRLTSHHYWIADGRAETCVSPHRYAWPAEYDLMARLAGLTLSERWSTWQRDPFTSDSTSHISVWKQGPME
jgi:SAM-dependent methyltransferase